MMQHHGNIAWFPSLSSQPGIATKLQGSSVVLGERRKPMKMRNMTCIFKGNKIHHIHGLSRSLVGLVCWDAPVPCAIKVVGTSIQSQACYLTLWAAWKWHVFGGFWTCIRLLKVLWFKHLTTTQLTSMIPLLVLLEKGQYRGERGHNKNTFIKLWSQIYETLNTYLYTHFEVIEISM